MSISGIGGDDSLTDDPRLDDVDTESSSFLKDFFTSPETTIIGLVAAWMVNNLILRPIGWTYSGLDWVFAKVKTTVNEEVRTAFSNAGSAAYSSAVGTETDPGAVWSMYLAIADGLQAAGLAGPIVATLTIVIMVSAVVVIVGILINLAGGAFLK